MNARERYLAIFDENERNHLDRIPIHVQYIRDEFISRYENNILYNYKGTLFNNRYFDIPYILGFDSIFAPFPASFKIKQLKLYDENGKLVIIKENGQSIRQKSAYYERGYIDSIEVLNELWANLKEIDNSKYIKKTIKQYENLAPYIFPVLTLDGIFDRVWRSMGMANFSRNFRKKTKLYEKLVYFYAELAKLNIEGLIEATGERGKTITLLDDVAFKGRSMISKDRWKQDFLPYYKEINSIILDSNMIPQIHTDGDPTELISSFQECGFQGLQGWEGGADPKFINDNFPDFVIVGFGDISYILPYGNKKEIENHVKELIGIFKENRHFIIGPSTVIFKEIPLKNIRTFIKTVNKYGNY